MYKAHEAIAATYAKRIRQTVEEELKNPGYLEKIKTLPHSKEATNVTALLLTKVLLMGMNHALGKKKKGHKFADGVDGEAADIRDVEALPFEEAVEYMRARLPLDAKEYYKLADKARFRAFTVSLLADGDLLVKTKNMLAKNLEEGGGLKDFLVKTDTDLLKGVGMAGAGGGWYWETVYRTGVQTAYNVGRAIGFETVPPVALELVGIGDARQTELCKNLTQPPVRRLYGDEFWKKFWPPLHFNCRTTVRAIYDEQELEEQPITGIPADAEEHKSQGWGSYPLDSDKWWEELPSMRRRAQTYGVQGMIEDARRRMMRNETSIEIGIPKPVRSIKDLKKMDTPLPITEAMKQVNPNYSDGFEWQNNCQRCCPTYEAIRRGYDVIAKPVSVNNGAELSNDKYTDYTTNAFALMFKDADIIKAKGFGKKEIKQAMKTWGDGARCEICIVNDEWFGHIFMAEQVDGKTIFLDPQTNQVYDESVFDHVKKGYTKYFRTDNLDFTDSIIDCCQNRKEAKK